MNLIGIDGGGTKTELVLCQENGQVLRCLKAGPTNPNDIGLAEALERLGQAIAQLSADQKNCFLFAGLSGVATQTRRREITQALRQKFPDFTIDCAGDMVIALSSSLLGEDGAVVIAGTGSIGYGKKEGHIYRVGGFGYLLDQGGSGYDLGRDAFSAALEAGDGRGASTLLRDMLTERLGQDPEEAIGIVYEKGKPFLASFAPLVFQAAEQGDEIARQILFRNTKALQRLIEALAKQMGVPLTVVAAGGIFGHFPQLKPFLSLPKEVSLVFPCRPPVFGAIVEAARLAGFLPDKDFVKNWKTSYSKQ